MRESLMSRWSDYLDEHPRTRWALRKAHSVFPPLNFITIHYAYFIFMSLATSVIFYGSSNPKWSISYVDSLFLTVSAMSEAGLNPVPLSQMTVWQQVLLWLLIILGSTIWVSIWTVVARKHVFEKRFEDIIRAERARRARRLTQSLTRTGTIGGGGGYFLRRFRTFRAAATVPPDRDVLPMPATGTKIHEAGGSSGANGDGAGLAAARTAPPAADKIHVSPPNGATDAADGSEPLRRWASVPNRDANESRGPSPLDDSRDPSPLERASPMAPPAPDHIAFVDAPGPRPGQSAFNEKPPLATTPFFPPSAERGPPADPPTRSHNFLKPRLNVGPNAQFHSLSSDERERIGGCEYRALKVLAILVPTYFWLWQLSGAIALGAWIAVYQPDTATANGFSPWWVGIFNAISAFNNSGMSLLDANVIPFQGAYFVLIVMGLLILAGNTAYPIFLRLILWTLLKLTRVFTADDQMQDWKATLEFILKYPRRVYTNLFPSRPTWWLLFVLVALNGVDWVSFELLNLGNPAVGQIPTGPRILDGLFQALAVRSGGFNVVPISSLYIGLQVLYLIMMYISAYPVVITMRHSNVYEERSLGIYAEEEEEESQSGSSPSDTDLERGRGTGYEHRRSSVANPDGEMPPPTLTRRTSTAAANHLTRRLTRTGTAVGQALRHTLPAFHGVGVPAPPAQPAPPPTSSLQQARTTRDHSAAIDWASSPARRTATAQTATTAATGDRRRGPGNGAAAAGSRISFVMHQVHGQLAHDIWWLVLAVLVITTIETDHFLESPVVYSVFNVIFEVVSAYGCVGISVGLPTRPVSFSGGWHGASKIVLCLVMLRGRHRDLPVALDRAVRLPGDQLHFDEEEDYRIRRSMTSRRLSLE